jgi:membrane fusion protein
VIELESELAATSHELKTNALLGKNQSALIERGKQELQQNLQENEIKRQVAILAPADGIVTSILVQPGQSVGSTPLLSIIPKDSVLQAEIYAPSNAIGFIKGGGTVLLRYRAFPYQKFGQFRGQIISISRAPVDARAANGMQSVSPAQMYRITVGLPAQAVSAYGQQEKLQAGMELDADILMDTRRLYEWLFEPLYSLKGKV